MKAPSVKPVRCAIYTRVSTEHGLDQEFNSLDAQYEAASAYIKSQAHAGWTLIRSRYDDGGYSGESTDRPDLQKLLDTRFLRTASAEWKSPKGLEARVAVDPGRDGRGRSGSPHDVAITTSICTHLTIPYIKD